MYNRHMKKCRSLLLNSSIRKKVKIIRYDVIKNIYDGFDELQNNSKFFDSNHDKEFFLLLPKINSQKLIDSYKAQEDSVIEYDVPKQIYSQYNIQIKQQFMDDVLEFTNSDHSSQSSDDSDKSDDSVELINPSRKNQNKDSLDSKLIQEELSSEMDLYSENSERKQQNNILKQQKMPLTFQLPQQTLNKNYIEQNKLEYNKMDSEIKKDSDQWRDFYLKVGSEIRRESEMLKKELNSSLHSHDRSSIGTSDLSKHTDNQGKTNEQQIRDQQKNLNHIQKEDNKRNMDKYATSEYKKKTGQRSQQRHNSQASQKQNNFKQGSFNNLVEQDEIFSSNSNANNQFSFNKIKTIIEQETFGRKGTRHNTIDNQLLQFSQNLNNVNYIDQIKILLELMEFKNQQQPQANKFKDHKDRFKKQATLANKQNIMKKSNNSQHTQNSLQPPLQQLQPTTKSGSFHSVLEPSNLVSFGSQQSRFVSQLKGISSSNNNDHNNWINSVNAFQNAECLFGKCGYKFDQMKEFENYYPKFNYTFVIKAYINKILIIQIESQLKIFRSEITKDKFDQYYEQQKIIVIKYQFQLKFK